MRISRRQSFKQLAGGVIAAPVAGAVHRATLPPVRLVVLDVGGTIIEDRGDVPDSLRRALASHQIPSTPEEIVRLRGASKREMIRHFVDRAPLPSNADRDGLSAAIYEEFTANLVEAYRSVPPIQGAEEAIRQMRASGYLVATTTGFDRTTVTSIFRRLGWEQYLAATVCSDDVVQGRPAPYMLFHAMEIARVNNVAEVIAVGDTPLDLQAGANAGLRAIGVLTGVGTAETLRREIHTAILPSVAELPALLSSKALAGGAGRA